MHITRWKNQAIGYRKRVEFAVKTRVTRFMLIALISSEFLDFRVQRTSSGQSVHEAKDGK